ncbi:MAG: hypothetical protein KAT65_04575, partial [Methanophagales archaeon]|nr:hypothetical protein [Methanophagales archaeon]
MMAKYLKDRRKEKRKLSLKEIEHYMRVAKAIERTMEVVGGGGGGDGIGMGFYVEVLDFNINA